MGAWDERARRDEYEGSAAHLRPKQRRQEEEERQRRALGFHRLVSRASRLVTKPAFASSSSRM